MLKLRFVLPAVVTLMAAVPAFGQNKEGFLMGFEIGPNLSNVRGNDLVNSYARPALGAAYGLTAQYNLTNELGFRSALLIEHKGFNSEMMVTDEFGNMLTLMSFRSTFHYLTIPLWARFEFGDDTRFFGQAGPYFSYLLNYTNRFDLYTDKSLYNAFDYGASLGAGVIFQLTGNWMMSVEVRDNFGLSNISATPVYNNGSIMTNAATLLLGVTCRFRK